jgi:hypothetical protein
MKYKSFWTGLLLALGLGLLLPLFTHSRERGLIALAIIACAYIAYLVYGPKKKRTTKEGADRVED